MKNEPYQNIAELYESNRLWVYGFFRKKLNSIEVAEDLAQTLWLKFFQIYESVQLKDDKAVKAYLRSMAEHLTADYFRGQQKSKELMQELFNLLDQNQSTNNVFEEAFPEDPLEYLDDAYEVLSEEEKLLIFLKYNEQLNSKEIAIVMGISPSLVRMRLSRTREKLRSELHKKMNK